MSAAAAVVKADITALGIPGTNTTYGVATQSVNGLMSAADKTKLDGRSKADAKAKYFAYIAEHGQAEKCSDLYTVSGWAAQWLLLYKRPYITDPAYSTTYELPIRRHILPALGNMLLVDVTPADILRFYQQASNLSPSMCGKIRITLGIMSSFLGIGGGPINLVVLYYFFSMSTKVAAQNSLYIILISQITSVTTTLFTKTVPEFEWLWLVLMVAGGIGGGAVGRKINKKIDDKHVEILFIGLMFTIIGISCYNTWALMK